MSDDELLRAYQLANRLRGLSPEIQKSLMKALWFLSENRAVLSAVRDYLELKALLRSQDIPPELKDQALQEFSKEEIADRVQKLKVEGGSQLDGFVQELKEVVQACAPTEPQP